MLSICISVNFWSSAVVRNLNKDNVKSCLIFIKSKKIKQGLFKHLFMGAIFLKKGQKMYKILKYFEKGQWLHAIIACNKLLE